MKIVVDFPLPPEFLLPSGRPLFQSTCNWALQWMHFIVAMLLALRNPYFDIKERRSNAQRLLALPKGNKVITVKTRHCKHHRHHESTYAMAAGTRIIVTEVRRGYFHGYYFHAQRVIAFLERDMRHGLLL